MQRDTISYTSLCTAVPLAAYGMLMGFAWRAYLQVGHWPYYSHPDPKDVGLFRPDDGFGVGFVILIHLMVPVSLCAAIVVSGNVIKDVVTAGRTRAGRQILQRCAQLVVCLFGLALFLAEFQRHQDWLAD